MSAASGDTHEIVGESGQGADVFSEFCSDEKRRFERRTNGSGCGTRRVSCHRFLPPMFTLPCVRSGPAGITYRLFFWFLIDTHEEIVDGARNAFGESDQALQPNVLVAPAFPIIQRRR